MCPWEKTAVCSGCVVHRRSSECILGAVKLEPVSTMKSPSSVVNAEQLPNVGRNATPSVISARSPVKTTGWCSLVDASPRHRRSANSTMSTRDYFSVSGAFVSLASVAFVVDASLADFKPFSNSVLADPRLRANFGIAAPPKTNTATTITTINRSGPKISPKNTTFSFDVPPPIVVRVPCGHHGGPFGRYREAPESECTDDAAQSSHGSRRTECLAHRWCVRSRLRCGERRRRVLGPAELSVL